MARAAQRANQDDKQNGNVVQSVVVATEVLDALAAAGEPVRLTDLAKSLGMPKARVYRHLATLRSLGLVGQDDAGERYSLGWRLFHLGQAAGAQFEIGTLARPYMTRLRDALHQTVVLSVPADGDALTVAVVESNNMVTITVREGLRLPPHASAQGRIVLAFSPDDVVERQLSRRLDALTPNATTDPAEVRARLDHIRESLFEIAPGENILGITALAAPILDRSGQLAGVIAVVGGGTGYPQPARQRAARARSTLRGGDVCQALLGCLRPHRPDPLANQASPDRVSGGTKSRQRPGLLGCSMNPPILSAATPTRSAAS